MDCEYRIIVNGFNRIVLNFQKVNLKRRYAVAYEISSYNDTYDDSLTIYDVDPVNSTSMLIVDNIFILKLMIFKNYTSSSIFNSNII